MVSHLTESEALRRISTFNDPGNTKKNVPDGPTSYLGVPVQILTSISSTGLLSVWPTLLHASSFLLSLKFSKHFISDVVWPMNLCLRHLFAKTWILYYCARCLISLISYIGIYGFSGNLRGIPDVVLS